MNRERTYGWEDPHALAEASRELSGLDFLTRLGAGELPVAPVSATTGVLLDGVGDGWAVFTLEPAEWHYNPIGSVHGGILSTLADSALGCAVHTKLPAGIGFTSLDLTMKFTRAATVDSGVLSCKGSVLTIGRRTATAEATITGSDDRVIAHAVSTCILMR
ncbi:PaaI family thioesterase [Aeromicrobium sp. HA]|uniref:PaaI family thioesterase n=1 Tax=Aeromicrobium sp. HA TaxID=3009077 RepID=UPI0022B0767E|nr:PaaI family thioesterase [Aeromicrobium sp. HA]